MSDQRIALKSPKGWFAAGREVARAMALLSDGAFKLYVHVCLTADRPTGQLKVDHGDLATALKKSRRSIVNYLEELRAHGICTTQEASNQHTSGRIEVRDSFWPYVKTPQTEDSGKDAAMYVEKIRGLLAARKCVIDVFNPADEKLAVELFQENVELQEVEHAILLACARRYVSLLNGTVVGPIAGLRYFSSAIQEVRELQASEHYWRYVASRVAKLEQQWASKGNSNTF